MIRRLVKWRDYAVARLKARRTVDNRIGRQGIRRILVVCYGNIYRSPFVAACLCQANDVGGPLEVRSSGFHQKEGRQVEPEFQALVRSKYGIDLSAHRSRRLVETDLQWADLVLIMDGHNYRMMHHDYRGYLDKCIWLGAVTSETPIIIRDPYKADTEMQQRVAQQLYSASRALIARLRAAAGVTVH